MRRPELAIAMHTVGSLPRDGNPDSWRVEAFGEDHLASQGMVGDWGIHIVPDNADGFVTPPHCHWLITSRTWRKDRDPGRHQMPWLSTKSQVDRLGGHRAATDVLALLHLLAHPVGDDGGTILGQLVTTAETPSLKVMAVGAPFDRKAALKRRGNRWDPNRYHWWTTVPAESEARERAFLAECVYRPGQVPQVKLLTWHDRYRE